MSRRAKNANGQGGVTFHKASGLWRARVTVNGKEVSRYAKTKTEASRMLTELRRLAADGLSVGAARLTVADYLASWLDDVAALRVRPQTLRGYRQHVQAYLVPAFGALTLLALQPRHIQRMIKDAAAAGLSPASVQRIHATLNAALHDAERQGLVTRNMARLVTLPKQERRRPPAIGADAAAAILEAARGHRLEALIVLAIHTGFRKGELHGLTWKAVDLVAGRLTVLEAMTWPPGGPVLAPPKTVRSGRTVELSADALAALRTHSERQRFEERAAGPFWQNSAGLVFVKPDGAPLQKNAGNDALADCLAAAGLPPMRFHDLRHAFATLCIQAGVDSRVIMAGMGHSSIQTTANVYAGVSAATSRDNAERLAALLTGAGKG